MSYFPFLINIEGKKGLVVGGGMVAYRKVKALLPFGVRLTVAALDFIQPFVDLEQEGKIVLVRRTFCEDDLEDVLFVIAATDDAQVNHEIAQNCRMRGILINAVDQKEDCSFFFPSLVKRGEVVVGISTGGNSPVLAKKLRKQIEREIPDYYSQVCASLGELREQVKECVDNEQDRRRCMEELLEEAENGKGQIEEEVIEKIMRKYIKKE